MAIITKALLPILAYARFAITIEATSPEAGTAARAGRSAGGGGTEASWSEDTNMDTKAA